MTAFHDSPSQRLAHTASSGGADDGLPRRFGKYTLLRRMATGGMAEIYLALQRSVAGFEKLIVIKRILPSMNQDRGFIDMLLHEARIAASLSHPNIVQTIDVGQVEGVYFIALEHIHGEDLRSIVRQMKRKTVTEFPLEHALSIVLGTCAGLAYAHEKRDLDGTPLHIVHRDISPQNVLVGFAGDVKIVDFGVAKSGAQTTDPTKSGQLKGKVPYMSPEQARGDEVDWRSDIFATGVMLFELTTGKRLFKGTTEFETLKLIIEKDYPRPSWVSAGYPLALEAIVMKALEKDREKRYQSAREMQADLEGFIRDAKLPVSSIALAEFMKGLFDEKLAAQKEALMQGRQLAEIVAQEVVHEGRTTTDVESGRISTASFSTASGTIATGTIPPPPRGARWPWIAAAAALAVAAGAFALLHKSDPPAVAAAPAEPAKPLRATLVVKSEPSGAHIWINGEVRTEVTPATFEQLPLGRLDVKVGMEGYASKTEAVELTAGPEIVRTFTLDKGVVRVRIDNAPAGASATVDGAPVDLPAFEIAPGESHTLVLTAPGHLPKTHKLNGAIGESKKLDGALDRLPSGGRDPRPTTAEPKVAAAGSGKLMISASGGWCNVSVDGKPQGATPTGALELPAGTHTVTCTDASGKSVSQGAKVNAGETTRVKFTL
jgi:serine/threonine-protein kinase